MHSPFRILAAVLFLTASIASAEEPPPLARVEAKQILVHMDWRDVNVLVIRQGVDEKGAYIPIRATVVAYASRNAKDQQVNQCLMYDHDIGWHLLEIGEKSSRMWNKEGYWEIKPWGTWTRMASK